MSNVSSESEKGNVKSGHQVAESPAGGQRGGQNETLTAEELRKRRQAYFDRWVSCTFYKRDYIGWLSIHYISILLSVLRP